MQFNTVNDKVDLMNSFRVRTNDTELCVELFVGIITSGFLYGRLCTKWYLYEMTPRCVYVKIKVDWLPCLGR